MKKFVAWYSASAAGGGPRMTRVSSLYKACGGLFADYPLAVENCEGTFASMVIMLRDGKNVEFYMLSRGYGENNDRFLLRPWRAGGLVEIEVGSDAPFPNAVVKALTLGVPIPRHGSLFGWRGGSVITALIAVYAEYSRECPEPCWAVMPLEGVPETRWPPFTDEPYFGQWFWEYYKTGSIVTLGDLIAEMPDSVFWANIDSILGSGCCVVARDIESNNGYVLRRGCYVHHQVLRTGKPLPPMRALLADRGKIDLTPRFRLPVHSDN